MSREHHREQDERDGARREREDDERRADPPPAGLQRQQAEKGERDAEGERELARQDHSRPDERERAAGPAGRVAPLPLEQARERGGGDRDREHCEEPIPSSAASG